MRVIVCGGRDYSNQVRVNEILWNWPVLPTSEFGGLRWDLRAKKTQDPVGLVIVHGAARGADTLADKAARRFGYSVEPHPAEWQTCRCRVRHMARLNYCPRAGFLRNEEMALAGAVLCVAFPGGNGTADMVSRARGTKIPVLEVDDHYPQDRRIWVPQSSLMKRA